MQTESHNFDTFRDYLRNKLNAAPIDNPKQSNIFTADLPLKDTKIIQRKIPSAIRQKIIAIDSRNRDTTAYPNSNNFQVNTNTSSQFHLDDNQPVNEGYASIANAAFSGATLEQTFKNIRFIKLEECIVPNFTADYPYLVLKIREIQDVIGGTSDTFRTGFAVLVPERELGTGGAWVTCKTKLLDLCQKTFNPPLAKLSTFTIEYVDPTGALYSFTDNAETLCILKICEEIPDKNQVFNYQIVP